VQLKFGDRVGRLAHTPLGRKSVKGDRDPGDRESYLERELLSNPPDLESVRTGSAVGQAVSARPGKRLI